MDDALAAQESTLRFCVLALAIALVAAWEGAAPRRRSSRQPLRSRWRANFGLWVLDATLIRVAGPSLGVGLAVVVAGYGGGILPRLRLPWWAVFVVSLVILDLGRYLEHWLFHRAPLLWRVHRVHHSDADYDFTVGLRFHPLEALVSIGLTMATIAALGAPPLAVLTHQLVSVAATMFVHGNVRVPVAVDTLLRRCIVTPDMHRVHHSEAMRESRSNLGTVLPWWDRLFGTYVDQPAAGHERIRFGLGGPDDPRHLRLGWMLLDPFLVTERPATRAAATRPVSSTIPERAPDG